MRTRSRRLLVPTITTLALVLSACGGDDDECEKEQERQRQAAMAKDAADSDLAYDATSKQNKQS